jgi:hypothetical protein
MFRIDTSDNTATLPTPAPLGTPGYFTDENGGTIVTQDWANEVQEEIAHAIEGAGETPDKTNQKQLLNVAKALIGFNVVDFINKTETSSNLALANNNGKLKITYTGELNYSAINAIISSDTSSFTHSEAAGEKLQLNPTFDSFDGAMIEMHNSVIVTLPTNKHFFYIQIQAKSNAACAIELFYKGITQKINLKEGLTYTVLLTGKVSEGQNISYDYVGTDDAASVKLRY